MNITVELKAFYPFYVKKNEIKGSLHIDVTIESIEIQLRGVVITRRHGDKFYCRFPLGRGTNHLTNETAHYPIFKFSNEALNREVSDQVYQKVPAFINEFMKIYKAPEELIGDGVNTELPGIDKNDGEILNYQSGKKELQSIQNASDQINDLLKDEAEKLEKGLKRARKAAEKISALPPQKPISEREWIDPPKRKVVSGRSSK